ncbi:MAG: D-mannonate dehydratase [Verrucomicrobia bacterium]|nr:MAG: D-mannonate dehydratase [Verrucomicrobiota bacterium]
MKLGFGLYRHMLTPENFAFAHQAGATHLVAHLVDYFRGGGGGGDQPTGTDRGWGLAGDPYRLWTVDELVALRRDVEAAGMVLEAIENFDPAHWHDILLDGLRRDEQVAKIRQIIRNVGAAGIPIIGYNFSIAGVAGRTRGAYARGGAESVGMEGPYDKPMPRGMVWNMVYDPGAPDEPEAPATPEQLWDRLRRFLADVLPVAEEAGVILALHPDDPPLPTVRGQPRLVYQPILYQRVIDLHPSPANRLEFCVGSLAEMSEGDVYEATETYARQGRIGYVHLRNVRGKVPHYKETFIDEGDVDVFRVLRILRDNGFTGVIVPDHAPQMTCGAPWHAGMAFAMGFLRAAMMAVEAAG